MQCPRCKTSHLEERDRDGVTIDVCVACRGIWLDRGELERLIALDAGASEHDEAGADSDRHPARARDSDPGCDVRPEERTRARKRGWFESLSDIFD